MSVHADGVDSPPQVNTAATFTELRAHGFERRRNKSPPFKYRTSLGTACAAAFLHCLETQAQTAIPWMSRKLRTVMRSSRDSTPAEGIHASASR